MQKLVRSIIQSVLFENKAPSIEELVKIPVQIPEKVLPTFVTIYDNEVIIASVGRLYPIKPSFLEELVDNTEQALKDPRFSEYASNPEKARNLRYRVDTFDTNSRRILHHPDDIDAKNEGMILICRKQKKVGVILPHILPETLS
jgi:AMMECR1 domain-containing protein